MEEVFAPGPIILGELRHEGKTLEIGCLNCNLHDYVDAIGIKLPDSPSVPDCRSVELQSLRVQKLTNIDNGMGKTCRHSGLHFNSSAPSQQPAGP